MGPHLLAIVSFLFVPAASSCPSGENGAMAELDRVLSSVLACRGSHPGMTVSVVKDSKTLMAKGYGALDLASGRPVLNTTLFGIASLTKAFASTLLLKLLSEDNRYSVETPVRQIMGDNFHFSTDLLTQYATLEDLLAHRFGIPGNNYIRFTKEFNLRKLVKVLQLLKPTKQFRSSFLYSSLMYGLVTVVTEKLGNSTWQNMTREKLFRPLGMNYSTFGSSKDAKTADVATPYLADYNGNLVPVPPELLSHWAAIGGSGAILSNAVDMAKWMNFHLAGGRNENGTEIMNNETLAEAYRPRNVMRSKTLERYFTRPQCPVTSSLSGYGLAWRTGHYRGLPTLSHLGTTWGYMSLITLVPSRKIGLFVSLSGSDRSSIFRTALQSYLLDIFLGEKPWLNETTLCSYPQPWFPKIKSTFSAFNKTLKTDHPVQDYTGEYRNKEYGTLTISLYKPHQLALSFGIVAWKLYPQQHDEFFGVGVGNLKFIYLTSVQFISNNSTIVSVIVTDLEPKLPPRFDRENKH